MTHATVLQASWAWVEAVTILSERLVVRAIVDSVAACILDASAGSGIGEGGVDIPPGEEVYARLELFRT